MRLTLLAFPCKAPLTVQESRRQGRLASLPGKGILLVVAQRFFTPAALNEVGKIVRIFQNATAARARDPFHRSPCFLSSGESS
jgi:hypothetical protein